MVEERAPQGHETPQSWSGDRLRDKIALVIGGGSAGAVPGTGSATSVLFARQGARVAVMGRTAAKTERTVAAIRAQGGDAIAIFGDATQDDDCARAVAQTAERFGGLDILFNNLGNDADERRRV